MATGIVTPTVALRSARGVEVWTPDQQQKQLNFIPDPSFTPDQSKSCRAIVYSPDGRFLAWANGATVQLCEVANGWRVIASLPRPKACFLQFSSRGTYLMTWEVYTENPKDVVKEKPNLYIYRAETGEEVFSVIQKRHHDWQMHWSSDESLAALLVGGEVLFYDHADPSGAGFQRVSKRLGGLRNGGVSMAPGPSPPHVAVYIPGTKGGPSMCRLFKYPCLEMNQPVASKSFFQADKVDMMWNRRGTGLILMTSTDVDQSGVSYYGKQALHYMTPKGDSCSVQLNAEGPIHDVAWSPKSNEFCVVYGFMPARATLFNLKCDAVYDFEPGNRNSIYYNGFGNLIVFGGFGNLPGYIETWDLNRRKQLASFKAPDTTLLEWSPTGDKFLTATTAPRLRIANGFKVWHYSGALLSEYNWTGELLEVIWQRCDPASLKETTITDEKVTGIVSTTPQASKQKYVPPGARNNIVITGGGQTIDLRPPIPGLPPGYRSSVQIKQAKKNKKKAAAPAPDLAAADETPGDTSEAKPSKKKPAKNAGAAKGPSSSSSKPDSGGIVDLANGNLASTVSDSAIANNNDDESLETKPVGQTKKSITGDLEKDKKIRAIYKKLKGIKQLKEKVERGESLNATQTIKLNSETELLEQLESLKLS